MTAGAKRFMEKSRAKVFADEVFPYIDEEPLRMLGKGITSKNTCVRDVWGADPEGIAGAAG